MNRRLLRLLLFLGFFFCDDARAGVFEVSLSSDDGDEHSLRWAVEQVNASADADNVIRFTTETVTLSKALPVLTKNVSFEAPAGGVQLAGTLLPNPTAVFSASGRALLNLPSGMAITTSGKSTVMAYGGDDIVYFDGDLAGDITTTTTTSYRAYGVWANESSTGSGDIIVDGSVSGNITTTAKSNRAMGLIATNVITIGGDVSGSFVTSAITGGTAYALYSSATTTIGGDLSGSITASAGDSKAGGISASACAVGGDLSGTIASTAINNKAYGLKLSGGLTVGGDLSGTINSTAIAGNEAYGITAKSGVNLIGGVSGCIVASAGGTDAAGIYVSGSSLDGGSLSDAAEISGTITASSSGASAAIMAWTEMNLNVTGTLSATGASAYAIRSGNFDGAGGFVDNTEERVDRVVLGSGAVLTGSVFLGDGDDVLTLSGTADISGVPELLGGTGDDRLVFSGWNGAYSSAMQGWEHLDVGIGSSVGMDALGSFSGEVSVLEGAVLRAGGAGHGDRIAGSLANSGLIELRDGNAGGSLRVDGGYAGGGSVGLDVGAGSADLLSLSGTVSGTTTLLLSVAPSVTELAAAEPSLLVHTRSVVAEDAFVVVDETDYGPYAASVSVVEDGTGATDWYYGVRGLDDEAVMAQALMPFLAGPIESFVPRFLERRAYGGEKGVSPEIGGAWVRAGKSWNSEELRGDAGSIAEGSFRFVQLGWDMLYRRSGKLFYGAGVFAGTGTETGSVSTPGGKDLGELEGTFYSGGAYGFVSRPGLYRFELAAGSGLHELDVRYAIAPKERVAAGSIFVSAELEVLLPLGYGVALSPRVQGLWRHVDGFSLAPLTTGRLVVDDDERIMGIGGLGVVLNTDCPGWYLVAEGTVRFEPNPLNSVSYPETGVTLETSGDRYRFGGSVTIGNRAGGVLDPVYWVKAGTMLASGSTDSFSHTVEVGVKVPF
ncbi:autotransporter outer membrane beta-barrel domain-containing protein [Chlorobium phaeovibrioides]|uniref:autotransporter outer membrane beta-barrel domain-containing protein n=1 Tax=Chlorobium phaeovibrioides TaxID=1094 RepID=UPI000F84B913|nr:autotransporter outer membrane beta-barrel domain-containing protein [Chlorobium phaeovibrioides]RTY36108.1 autotransporter outer membrane beta-barrel domain-containing protein [Chlorobium phaeovibrioides]